MLDVTKFNYNFSLVAIYNQEYFNNSHNFVTFSEDMISDMMRPEFRNYMKDISSSKYGVDLSLKPCDGEPVGTFRKLTID